MNELIAYCGLDCEQCDARIATVNDDNALREKTSTLWTELNQVEITPDMINCLGCRSEGVKTPFCDSMCEIRQCAQALNLASCGACSDLSACEKITMIIGNNEAARERLGV